MTVIAWDIETCPLPYESLPEPHRKRHKHEYEYHARTDKELTSEQLKAKAGALHPFLGWICCISVVRGELGGPVQAPRSWTAGGPDEEEALLRTFWEAIGAVTDRIRVGRWVTFNGKKFDVPFLKARSIRYGLAPVSRDMMDTYPYNQTPHTDLSNVLQSTFYSLDDLCSHLGVESPKAEFDGSMVAPAVAEGRIDEVQAYCEQDVRATYECAVRLQPVL